MTQTFPICRINICLLFFVILDLKILFDSEAGSTEVHWNLIITLISGSIGNQRYNRIVL